MANEESTETKAPVAEVLLTPEERAYRKKLIDYRVARAKAGVEAFHQGNYIEAVRGYQDYILILEEAKCVVPGGLIPIYFKPEVDMAELILLSGVYWDLAKIYDKTRSKKKQTEFLHYLEKFVLFTKGMPYEEAMAQAVKKYVQSDRCWNKSEFTQALGILGKSPDRCFVATELRNEISPQTMPTLRVLRDQILRKNKRGRNFIAWYYRTGPTIALKIRRIPKWIKATLGLGLDLFASILRIFLDRTLMDQSSDPVRSENKLTIRKTYPKR